MADYRLSAGIISRGKGQSSVASAAYRTATRLDDPRTGEAHDYTRKRGVVFSAIDAPDNAPSWMRDRAQLWQAVERVEKRKDAQLAREIQLSLPHELTDAQRQTLLVGFVREQFVARGMVADIAIHAPGKEGDDRNHHAHVMLTTRTLTGDGFGNKVRDWNDPTQLAQWREAWARHQNRDLERHGHAARVDHRSYADRGVDREPAQHLGPTAADMERKGKPSRIGHENRVRSASNAARADRYSDHFRAEQAQRKFETWAADKARHVRATMQRRRDVDGRTMQARHAAQRAQLDDRLRQRYGTAKATLSQEVAALDRRLQATGLRKLVRAVTGRTRSDSQARQDLTRTLRGIEQRETDRRRVLDRRQGREVEAVRHQSAAIERKRLDGIDRLREAKADRGWKQEPASPAPPTPYRTASERAGAKPAPASATPPQPAPEAVPSAQRRDWWKSSDPAATPEVKPERSSPDRPGWRSDLTRGPSRDR